MFSPGRVISPCRCASLLLKRGDSVLFELGEKNILSPRCPSGNVLLDKESIDSQCSDIEENTYEPHVNEKEL